MHIRDSIVLFYVRERSGNDENDESTSGSLPFHVAYAVSTYKDQGLERDSVKVVITDSHEEDVTRNMFHTAITRARE